MKTLSVTVCALVLLVNLSGCPSGDAEPTYKRNIEVANELADAIEKKDEAKAKSAAKELNELDEKLKTIKVTESEKKRIEEKYAEDLKKARARLFAAQLKEPEFAGKLDFKK